MTALMAAAMMGQTPTVQLLLDRGADLGKKDHDGRTPLMWAAQYGRSDTVALLIQKGADVKATDNKGDTALSLAQNSKIKNEAMKKVEELLSKDTPAESAGK